MAAPADPAATPTTARTEAGSTALSRRRLGPTKVVVPLNRLKATRSPPAPHRRPSTVRSRAAAGTAAPKVGAGIGSIASILYRGDYAGIGEVYEAPRAWIEQHGHVPAGPARESYLNQPDVPEPRTVVQRPCRPAGPTASGTERR